jgi:hypothetical protein
VGAARAADELDRALQALRDSLSGGREGAGAVV